MPVKIVSTKVPRLVEVAIDLINEAAQELGEYEYFSFQVDSFVGSHIYNVNQFSNFRHVGIQGYADYEGKLDD